MNVSKTRKYETAANLLRQKRQAASTDKCATSDPVKSSRELSATTTATTVTLSATSATGDTNEANTSKVAKNDPSGDSDASSIVTTSSCSCEDHSDLEENDDAHDHSNECTAQARHKEQAVSTNRKENNSHLTSSDAIRQQEYKIKKSNQNYSPYAREESDHGPRRDDKKVSGQSNNHNSHKTVDLRKRRIYSPTTSSSSSPHMKDRSSRSRHEEFDLHHERSGIPAARAGGGDQRISNRSHSHHHYHQETLYDRHGQERHLLDDRKRKHYNADRDFNPNFASSSSSYHRPHRPVDERAVYSSSLQHSKSRYEQNSNHQQHLSSATHESRSRRNRSRSSAEDESIVNSRKRYRTNHEDDSNGSRERHSQQTEHRSCRQQRQSRTSVSTQSKQSPAHADSHLNEVTRKKEHVTSKSDKDNDGDNREEASLPFDHDSIVSHECGKGEDTNDATNGTSEDTSDGMHKLQANDKVDGKEEEKEEKEEKNGARGCNSASDVDGIGGIGGIGASDKDAVNNHQESRNGGNSKLKSTLVKVTSSSVRSSSKSGESKSSRLAVKSYHDLLSYFFKDAIYFIMKSNIQENIDIAMAKSLWSTPALNEAKLNYSFLYYRNVILIFSTKESGKFAGFARLSSPLKNPPNGRVNWILPNGMNEETFFNGAFELDWICKNDLLFTKTCHLFNPLNEGKPVKIARDGQQVDNAIAEQLISLFPQDDSIDLIPLLKKMKRQTKNRPSIMPPMVSMVPMMIHQTTNGYGAAIHPPDGSRRERLSVHHRLGPKLTSRLGPPPIVSPAPAATYDPYHRPSGHWKRRWILFFLTLLL